MATPASLPPIQPTTGAMALNSLPSDFETYDLAVDKLPSDFETYDIALDKLPPIDSETHDLAPAGPLPSERPSAHQSRHA